MLYYLDSSAWVKRYFNEAGREWVNGLFEQHEVLGCSPLGLIEVGSTMARKRTGASPRRPECTHIRVVGHARYQEFTSNGPEPPIAKRGKSPINF